MYNIKTFVFNINLMLQFENLRCAVCGFDTFIYCNVIAIEAMFIPSGHYSTVLLTILSMLCISSYGLFSTDYKCVSINTINLYPNHPSPSNHHFTLCKAGF